MEYAYRLAPYRGKSSRLTCPNCGRTFCFSPYIDDAGNILDPTVGRCDHESSCAYHKTPADFFKEHPELRPRTEDWRRAPDWLKKPVRQVAPAAPAKQEISVLPVQLIKKTIRLNPESNLITFLKTLFPEETIQRLVQTYWLGVTKTQDTVFYQIDTQGRIRAGKIIRYNPETGHRIKDDTSRIPVDWVHTRLKKRGDLAQSWTLNQCLFGEHLLPQRPDAIVCLVEAEKTAVICSGFLPDFVWVATGGKGQLGERLDSLYGRRVIAFPDVDAYQEWTQKLKERPWLSILVSDYLETTASEDERNAGADIADRLITWSRIEDLPPETRPIHPIQAIQAATESFAFQVASKYISPEVHPELKALIDDLGLEIKSITYIKPQENESID